MLKWPFTEAFKDSPIGTRAFSVAGPVCWNALRIINIRQIFRLTFLNTTLKHFYFVDTDISTTVAH